MTDQNDTPTDDAAPRKVIRSSKGLQDTLFDEIDALRDGTTTPQSARTVASLANGIIQTARLEMDHARFISEPRSGSLEGGTKAIELGTQELAA